MLRPARRPFGYQRGAPHALAVALAAVLAVLAARPAPGRAQASRAQATNRAETIDAARLMHDLSVLAHDSMQGRAARTDGNAAARAFLVRTLRDVGLDPVAGSYEHPFDVGPSSGVNVVASLPGQSIEAPWIVLSAHYDHEGVKDGEIYNGADDNASGVAAVLELVRAFTREPLNSTVIVLLTDAEEEGLVGARAFVRDPPVALHRVKLNVNLDMVSRTSGTLWAVGAYHTRALRPVLERVAERAPLTLLLGRDMPANRPNWTTSSDHAAFHEAGIPFVYFGVDDHPDYHRPTDDVGNVDPAEYVASVETILMALRALDAALPTLIEDAR